MESTIDFMSKITTQIYHEYNLITLIHLLHHFNMLYVYARDTGKDYQSQVMYTYSARSPKKDKKS